MDNKKIKETQKGTILVIDDEPAICESLYESLTFEDYDVETSTDPRKGLQMAIDKEFDLIISDVKMPGMDGLELLQALQEKGVSSTVCMMSAHGNIETAVKSMRAGAFDFVEKPFMLDRLFSMVQNALAFHVSNKDGKNRQKRKVAIKTKMIGKSEAMEELRLMLVDISESDSRVLIVGENGTGKEVIAKLIHEMSTRAKGPMIEVNCAAIPSELIESELFGHEKGSFTSAIKQKTGKFEQANGGTIFLDEIGDMSLAAQAKVLRVLQENKMSRVGAEKDMHVDARVIAATNKDLKKEMKEGRFREDLYHRLAPIVIQVPPLRERTEDIPLLIDYFKDQICSEQNISPKEFTPEAIEALQALPWTGNIRELRNIVERLLVLCHNDITEKDVKKHTAY